MDIGPRTLDTVKVMLASCNIANVSAMAARRDAN
jgi:hypothetical protein